MKILKRDVEETNHKILDRAAGMPLLILHHWDFNKDVIKKLHNMGYYIDVTLPEHYPDKPDILEDTALATYPFYWIYWEYDADPNESDPGVMNFPEDEFVQDGSEESRFWKDHIDCGTDVEKFLKLASEFNFIKR